MRPQLEQARPSHRRHFRRPLHLLPPNPPARRRPRRPLFLLLRERLTAWIRTEADFAWWQPHVLHPLDPFSSGSLSGGYSRPAPAERKRDRSHDLRRYPDHYLDDRARGLRPHLADSRGWVVTGCPKARVLDAPGVGLGACVVCLDALAGKRTTSEFRSPARRRSVKIRVPEIVRGVNLT
jgi:hypothetical protein